MNVITVRGVYEIAFRSTVSLAENFRDFIVEYLENLRLGKI